MLGRLAIVITRPRIVCGKRISSSVRLGISDDPSTAQQTGDGDAERLAAAAKDMLHVDTEEAAKQANEFAHGVVDGLQDAVKSLKDTADRVVSSASHAAHEVVSGEAMHRAMDTVKHAVEHATHIPDDVNQTLHDMKNERPQPSKAPPKQE